MENDAITGQPYDTIIWSVTVVSTADPSASDLGIRRERIFAHGENQGDVTTITDDKVEQVLLGGKFSYMHLEESAIRDVADLYFPYRHTPAICGGMTTVLSFAT